MSGNSSSKTVDENVMPHADTCRLKYGGEYCSCGSDRIEIERLRARLAEAESALRTWEAVHGNKQEQSETFERLQADRVKLNARLVTYNDPDAVLYGLSDEMYDSPKVT